ncbi:MAG: YdiU family protein [Akkermansiaceae bacterium]|nr:YdiU family protein [Akkermansiaceae bacterium]
MDLTTANTSAPPPVPGWRLEQSYATLPALLFRDWQPEPVARPRLVVFNRRLAGELGLDAESMETPMGAAVFAGNASPPGARPLAQAYAGHQFGHFTGLGDGRAILLGEQITADGRRVDIQLKGSGPTPFSRGGDGRAALGPMLREFLISEAMHALGIPTTRSLAVAATGQPVFRQDGPLPGAVLTRVAASHIRVGTFEWVAAHGDHDALRALTDYTIRRHFPHLAGPANPALALLGEVIGRQAALVALWMQTGFIHGVMNTDNMALSGETIDYGPCAFMDGYHPDTAFSSIDHGKRYAYGNQPRIAQWNLARFAETLLPILDPDRDQAIALATAAVRGFADLYERHWLAGMGRKLGIADATPEDQPLIGGLLEWMAGVNADFTNTFLALGRNRHAPGPAAPPCEDPAFWAWRGSWLARLGGGAEPPEEALRLMAAHNPVVIPRNHVVEEALAAAVERDDMAPFHRLLEVVAQPYAPPVPPPEEFTRPAPADAPPYRTYCGT